MVEIVLSVCLFIAGAIIEHNTKGQITQIIMYSDKNITVECVK